MPWDCILGHFQSDTYKVDKLYTKSYIHYFQHSYASAQVKVVTSYRPFHHYLRDINWKLLIRWWAWSVGISLFCFYFYLFFSPRILLSNIYCSRFCSKFQYFAQTFTIYPGPAESVRLLRFWPDQFSQGKNKIPFLQKASIKQKC